MTATTKKQIATVIDHASSIPMKEPIKDLFLHICYLMLHFGKSDENGLYIETSANRLKSVINRSKATTARYINTLIKTGCLCRSVRGFKESSRLYINISCLNISSKNETLVNTFKNNKYNKSINGSDLITIEYEFYKEYHSENPFCILNRTITDADIRYLMSLLTEQDLDAYRSRLPERVTRQYVINGLFMIAFQKQKEIRKKEYVKKAEKIAEEAEPYTLDEIKEEYAYEVLADEVDEKDRPILDMMMQILAETRNELKSYILVGKEHILKSEFVKTTEMICVETAKLILERFNNAKNIRNPKAYLKTLLYRVEKEEEWNACVFARKITEGYIDVLEERKIDRQLAFFMP